MITHEFDLDAPPATVHGPTPASAARIAPETAGPDREPGSGTRGGRFVIAIAMALASVAVGAVLAAAPAGRPSPQPISSILTVLDVTVSGRVATVTLRLTVSNPGPEPARATRLLVDDANVVTSLPLDLPVVPGATAWTDLALHPDCLGTPENDATGSLAARLLVSGSDEMPVLLADQFSWGGGLCGLLDRELQRGWRSPVVAQHVDLDHGDLVLDVPSLDGLDVAGSPSLGGVMGTSAYANRFLLPATITDRTQLRLTGPAPCIDGTVDGTIPMTLRLLVHDGDDLGQTLVQVGPALARWLTSTCPA